MILCFGRTSHGKSQGSFYYLVLLISVCRIKTHLQPLTVAALALQGTNAGLGDVLLTFANLYQAFGKLEGDDNPVRTAVQASIIKRWDAADQDVFILAVFFDPVIRATLFKRGAGLVHGLPAGLNQRVQRVWRRIYHQPSDAPENSDLHLACSDYYARREEFSDSMLNTAPFERRAKEKVG